MNERKARRLAFSFPGIILILFVFLWFASGGRLQYDWLSLGKHAAVVEQVVKAPVRPALTLTDDGSLPEMVGPDSTDVSLLCPVVDIKTSALVKNGQALVYTDNGNPGSANDPYGVMVNSSGNIAFTMTQGDRFVIQVQNPDYWDNNWTAVGHAYSGTDCQVGLTPKTLARPSNIGNDVIPGGLGPSGSAQNIHPATSGSVLVGFQKDAQTAVPTPAQIANVKKALCYGGLNVGTVDSVESIAVGSPAQPQAILTNILRSPSAMPNANCKGRSPALVSVPDALKGGTAVFVSGTLVTGEKFTAWFDTHCVNEITFTKIPVPQTTNTPTPTPKPNTPTPVVPTVTTTPTPLFTCAIVRKQDTSGNGLANWPFIIIVNGQITNQPLVTGSNGEMQINNLPPGGIFTAQEIMQSGWTNVSATTQVMTLGTGSNCARLTFVNQLVVPVVPTLTPTPVIITPTPTPTTTIQPTLMVNETGRVHNPNVNNSFVVTLQAFPGNCLGAPIFTWTGGSSPTTGSTVTVTVNAGQNLTIGTVVTCTNGSASASTVVHGPSPMDPPKVSIVPASTTWTLNSNGTFTMNLIALPSGGGGCPCSYSWTGAVPTGSDGSTSQVTLSPNQTASVNVLVTFLASGLTATQSPSGSFTAPGLAPSPTLAIPQVIDSGWIGSSSPRVVTLTANILGGCGDTTLSWVVFQGTGTLSSAVGNPVSLTAATGQTIKVRVTATSCSGAKSATQDWIGNPGATTY